MRLFLASFALTYVATTLLGSGVGHAVRSTRFRELITQHGVIPAPLTNLVALGVAGGEIVIGGVAVLSLPPSAGGAMRISALLSAAVAGGAFALYLRRLLRHPGGATSCGCSPLPAPLTRASLAPSLGLVVVAVVGLVASGGAPPNEGALLVALPCLWGMTFAGLTALYPAAVLYLPARGGR